MTTAVVYYSLSGNCQKVAEKISETSGAELFRISCEKQPSATNPLRFLIGGFEAIRGMTPPIHVDGFDSTSFDRIVLVCPVWASTFTPAVGSFLKDFSLVDKQVLIVGCSSSGNAASMFNKLCEKLPGSRVTATLSLKEPGQNPSEFARLDTFCRECLD
jgi:flavodoxin